MFVNVFHMMMKMICFLVGNRNRFEHKAAASSDFFFRPTMTKIKTTKHKKEGAGKSRII
jgi:hypothetical protein